MGSAPDPLHDAQGVQAVTSIEHHAGRLTVLCEAQAHRIEHLEAEVASLRRINRKTECWATGLVSDLQRAEQRIRALEMQVDADEPLDNIVHLRTANGGKA
jgi:DNA repair ATPase RecN